jgi:serine/threonine-protein kinase HSL1 (negative regulator of Swe1 kinase)
MNWLSRFLHIKPASRTLCFHVGRGKVRQDLVRLLRDWQRFGVRDVAFDRKTNVINACVDKANRKYLSPSHFLFSEWNLKGFCFRVEIMEAESVRYNCALSSFSSYSNT